jgi:hypothetical protein
MLEEGLVVKLKEVPSGRKSTEVRSEYRKAKSLDARKGVRRVLLANLMGTPRERSSKDIWMENLLEILLDKTTKESLTAFQMASILLVKLLGDLMEV